MSRRWVHEYARAFRKVKARHPDTTLTELYARTDQHLRERKVERLVTEAAQLSRNGQRDVEEAVERAVDKLAKEGTTQGHIDEVKGNLFFAMLSAVADADRENLRATLELRSAANLVTATRWLAIVTALLVLATVVLVIITYVKG